MLHSQAGTCYADPADEAHEDGLAAGFHELHEIGVQADGGHGHDDEELGKRLQWRERRRVGTGGHGDGGDDAGHEEEQDEHREGVQVAVFGDTDVPAASQSGIVNETLEIGRASCRERV